MGQEPHPLQLVSLSHSTTMENAVAVEREIPDSHVTCIADQFCQTAELLFHSVPTIEAPHALRCNAVFAIELYIKSLNCHWVPHNQLETLGVDCDATTTKPNIRGHKLDKLFDSLDSAAQRHLSSCFASHRLSQKYPGLHPILAEYSDNFATDRYIFESLADDPRHPISETVELAVFFRGTINAITAVRT